MDQDQKSPKIRPYHIGIDIGFGDVKAVFVGTNGDESSKTTMIRFPTAVARTRRQGIKGLANAQTKYLFENREYIVGTDALSSERVMPTRDMEFILSYAPLFVFKIFESLSLDYQVSLVEILRAPKKISIGLPLAYFFRKKEELIARLQSFHVAGHTVRIPSIEVFAQGQGVFFDFLLINGKANKTWKGKTLLICDIGFNTVDILCIDKGKADPDTSKMIQGAGIWQICKELESELRAKDLELSEQVVKDALYQKKFANSGHTIRLDKIISELSVEYAQDLYLQIKSQFQYFLQRADKMVLAGGGAYYVRDYFSKNFSESFIHVPAKAEFSNARGYLKIAETLN